jgi:hypothetical protein
MGLTREQADALALEQARSVLPVNARLFDGHLIAVAVLSNGLG